MRYSFLLQVEFRGDIRGKDKQFVTEQLKDIAASQEMHCFGHEEDDAAQYAFFARPDLVDERRDQYEVGALREVLRVWLAERQNVVKFELEAVGRLDSVMPIAVNSNNQVKRDRAVSSMPILNIEALQNPKA